MPLSHTAVPGSLQMGSQIGSPWSSEDTLVGIPKALISRGYDSDQNLPKS